MTTTSCCRTNCIMGLIGLLSTLFFLISMIDSASAATRTIRWSPNLEPDIAGYQLFWGSQSGNYDNSVTVSSSACFSLSGLSEERTYYIAIMAYDWSGQYSDRSEEISFNIHSSGGGAAQTVPVMTISYQPSYAPVTEGCAVDTGQVFSDEIGYGWIKPPASYGPRDRNNRRSPDQTFDTMIHVTSSAVWELAVPNGVYNVTVCAGDPTWAFGIQNIQVEDLPIIDYESLSRRNRWIEHEIAVDVLDGRLTLTFDGSDPIARLAWIRIEGLNFDLQPGDSSQAFFADAINSRSEAPPVPHGYIHNRGKGFDEARGYGWTDDND